MNVLQYSENLTPSSDFCVLVLHQENAPYVGGFNYFNNISLKNITHYCQQYDIDLVILSNFKKNQYKSYQAPMFSNRVTEYGYIVTKDVMSKYGHSLMFNSSQLLTLNMKHLSEYTNQSIVTVPNFVGVKQLNYTTSIISQHPIFKNKISTTNFFKQNGDGWWSGPGYILAKNQNHWWNDTEQILSYNSNDMAYRYQYYANNESSRQDVHKNQNLNCLQLDYMIRLLLPKCRNEFQIFKEFKSTELKPFLDKPFYTSISFSGCGSYSNIWKLRYLLMKYIDQQYAEFIF